MLRTSSLQRVKIAAANRPLLGYTTSLWDLFVENNPRGMTDFLTTDCSPLRFQSVEKCSSS